MRSVGLVERYQEHSWQSSARVIVCVAAFATVLEAALAVVVTGVVSAVLSLAS